LYDAPAIDGMKMGLAVFNFSLLLSLFNPLHPVDNSKKVCPRTGRARTNRQAQLRPHWGASAARFGG
jgi:hypothetical protein